MKNLRRSEDRIIPPLKAIRKHCIECMGGSVREIEKCSAPKCWLFPYRFGTDPRRKKRKITTEQKNALLRRGRCTRFKNGTAKE